MDWKQFFASIIGSLAWPAVVGFLLFLLKDELPRLIRRIKAATVAGNSVEFGEALEKGREEADVLVSEHPDIHRQPVFFLDKDKLELAQRFPEAAILDAYREVEQVLLEIREQLDLPTRSNLRSVVRRLVELRYIEAETEPFFVNFQRARNATAHSTNTTDPVTPGGATEYLGQARLLLTIFQEAREKMNKGK
jgi:hypothetical protein